MGINLGDYLHGFRFVAEEMPGAVIGQCMLAFDQMNESSID